MTGTAADVDRLAAHLGADLTDVPDTTGEMRARADALRLKSDVLLTVAGRLSVLAEIEDARADADVELEHAATALRDAKTLHDTASAALAAADAELAEARRRARCAADGTGDADMAVRVESRALRVAFAEEIAELDVVRKGRAAAAEATRCDLTLARDAMHTAQQAVAMLAVVAEDPLRWGVPLSSWRAYALSGQGWWKALQSRADGREYDDNMARVGDGMLDHLLEVTGRRAQLERGAANREHVRVHAAQQLGAEMAPDPRIVVAPYAGGKR